MANSYAQDFYSGKYFSDVNTRIRDIEEKQRLLRDRILLISETFIKDREKNFDEIQKMKKELGELKIKNEKLKEILIRMSEQVEKTARKEELMILQRQFELFRKK